MLDKEFAFYEENEESFINEHLGEYVAIKDETILGYYPNVQDAYQATVKDHELGTFFLQKIVPTEERTQKFHSRVLVG